MLVFFLSTVSPLGCTVAEPTDTSTGADSGSDSGADSGGDADGVRTLANCGGSFGDGTPAFFSRYFACLDISADDDTVLIRTHDLPPHLTYYYGEDAENYVAWDDRGGDYHPNPSTLDEQDITLRIPKEPVAKGIVIDETLVDLEAETSDDEYHLGPAGVALDSVEYFNATAAPGDDILDEQWTFDTYEAHPAGPEYHYHVDSPGPLEVLVDRGIISAPTNGSADIELYGIMCDGTVLLGCTELDGSAADATDFDAQNGHVGDIVDEAGTTHFSARYHVHLCDALGHYGLAPEIQYYETCDILR